MEEMKKSKKKSKKKTQPEGVLSPGELVKLETISKDIEIAKLKAEKLEQSMRSRKLELEILNTRVGNEIKKIEEEAKSQKTKEQDLMKKRTDLINKMKEKHQIEGDFGYDPETGRVIKSDQKH